MFNVVASCLKSPRVGLSCCSVICTTREPGPRQRAHRLRSSSDGARSPVGVPRPARRTRDDLRSTCTNAIRRDCARAGARGWPALGAGAREGKRELRGSRLRVKEHDMHRRATGESPNAGAVATRPRADGERVVNHGDHRRSLRSRDVSRFGEGVRGCARRMPERRQASGPTPRAAARPCRRTGSGS